MIPLVSLAWIGLGGNLGDREARLDAAVAALDATHGVSVRAVSSYHETAPVGGPSGQGAFLNAAASVETTLDPEPLLDRLQAIETQSGRVRKARWDERTLDLDLLLFDDAVFATPRLEIPHPRMLVRRFVLAPLAEIAPDLIEPTTHQTISALLANLDRRPTRLVIALDRDDLQEIQRQVIAGLGKDDVSNHADWIVTAHKTRPPDLAFASNDPNRVSDPEPTFLVLDHRPERANHSRAPMIRPENDAPAAIVAEILAACRATRSA